MSKRPPVDLSALTSEQAVPMPEAAQRAASNTPAALTEEGRSPGSVKTAHLEALAFKVSPAFRKRFKQRALAADLKLNELLFAALDAWEAQQGLKK
jgi:hypothetical protein